jgi:hypothetical protein
MERTSDTSASPARMGRRLRRASSLGSDVHELIGSAFSVGGYDGGGGGDPR